MRFFLVGLSVATLLAGCLGGPAGPVPVPGMPVPAVDATAFIVHDASGLLPTARGLAPHAYATLPLGLQGGEPTIGIAKDGTLFVGGVAVGTGGEGIARSRDGGKTWTGITDPRQPPLDMDPWLWLDPLTQRVYDAPLYVACDNMAWSDDGGATWSENPAAGCPLPAHDHQKVTTGPPARGVTTTGYPDVVYYAYNSVRPATHAPDGVPGVGPSNTSTGWAREGTAVSVSLDGGKTWSLPALAHGTDDCSAGIDGPVAVAADGTAILAKGTCASTDVSVSRDSGATWNVVAKFPIGGFPDFAYDPPTAWDSAGNAYVAMVGKDGVTYLSTSRDDAKTWSPPVRVSAPATTATAYLVLDVGAPGHAVIGTIETNSPKWSPPAPSTAPAATVWHAWFTWTDNALDANPTFTSERATPADDPVQVGCIWLRGGSNACRNLGDFVDMHALDGRPYLVYTDGCAKCTSDTASRDASVLIIAPATGPSLLGGTLGEIPVPAGS